MFSALMRNNAKLADTFGFGQSTSKMMMSAKKCEVNDLCNLDLCLLFLKRHAEHRPFFYYYYLYFLLLEMQLQPRDSVEGSIY